MQRPPPISQFVHYPVTGGLAVLTIIATLASMNGHSIDALTMNYLAFHGEPWRLVTSIFPHGGIIHILFNLLWLWSLGTVIEQHFGHLRMAILCLILAVGSSAAQYAFEAGGIGLSGVVYGLWGFLWMLGRYEPRWRDVVDQQTNNLFIGWFFLCIVLTLVNVWHIANVAHGSGALFGALIGISIVRPLSRQRIAAAALVLLLAAAFVAATIGRPLVNFSKDGGDDLAVLGYQAIQRNDYPAAIHFYQLATSMHRTDADWWNNLAYAYHMSGNETKAAECFAIAQKMGYLPKQSSNSKSNSASDKQ